MSSAASQGGFPVFQAKISALQQIKSVLKSLMLGKQHRWITFAITKNEPLRISTESDDLSMQCSAEIPEKWFDEYHVQESLSLTVELKAVLSALALCDKSSRSRDFPAYDRRFYGGQPQILLKYGNTQSNALTVASTQEKLNVEVDVLLRQVSSVPLDLGFDRYNVGASLSCPLAMFGDILATFSSFGCEQVSIARKADHSEIIFTGIGSAHGKMSACIEITAENRTEFRQEETFSLDGVRFVLSSLILALGGSKSGQFSASDLQDIPIKIQWNEAGMRLLIEWEHELFTGSRAIGNFVLLPFVV